MVLPTPNPVGQQSVSQTIRAAEIHPMVLSSTSTPSQRASTSPQVLSSSLVRTLNSIAGLQHTSEPIPASDVPVAGSSSEAPRTRWLYNPLAVGPLLSTPSDSPDSPAGVVNHDSKAEAAFANSPPVHSRTVVLSATHPVVDELLEWEKRKKGTSVWLHAVSGSCAGVVEHLAMFPVDTIKTRAQALTRHSVESIGSYSTRRIWQETFAESGVRGMFRGFPALCAGCIPAHAALFTVYEVAKAQLSTSNPISSALCGSLATISHDFILTPFDVVKQRLQLGCYSGLRGCIATILRTEGWIAFYRSMPTTIFMNVPFGAILVTVNEGLKRYFCLNSDVPEVKTMAVAPAVPPSSSVSSLSSSSFPPSPSSFSSSASSSSSLSLDQPVILTLPFSFLASYFLCAGIAGGVAGALTTPLDVIKTRLQTQDIKLTRSATSESSYQPPSRPYAPRKRNQPQARPYPTQARQYQPIILKSPIHDGGDSFVRSRQPRYTNFWPTVKRIYLEEGVRGFWRGTTARLALSVPSAAICWGTYESVVYLLSPYF